MTIEGDQPRQIEETDSQHAPRYVGEALASRDVWDWVQLIGLGLLAAGVAVLVWFALMLGGR
jgi:hypothetical protein